MKLRFTARKKAVEQSIVSSTIKTGVLLTNLGSPEQADASSLRKYLREFLSDRRVVEIPRLVWMMILHGIVLRTRPAKSAKLYQSIWTDKGAPLVVISEAQKQKVAEQLASQYGDSVTVAMAMRYGSQSISKALKAFQQQGIENIVILPLYPQYAGPTTGSTFDAIVNEIKSWRWVPSLHFISTYHDNALYIDALANSIEEHMAKHGVPDKLVLSYHGMPECFYQWGDPYFDFCQKSTSLLIKKVTEKLIAKKIDFPKDNFITTFQSRFGKAKWLQPYTEESLRSLPAKGDKHIAVISPAFSADCLETLQELEMENRDVFMDAGGEQYHYIAALNDRDDHINALVSIVKPFIKS